MEKTIILIDGGYYDAINRWIKAETSKRMDMEKLSLKICAGKNHIRTKFYHSNPYQSTTPTADEKLHFQGAQEFQYTINHIKNHEFWVSGRVVLQPFHCPICRKRYEIPKQKGVDVAIALDLVKMARKKVADCFVLIAGDEDLSSAVEMAQEELCNVIIYYVHEPAQRIFCSAMLRSMASDRTQMNLAFLKDCLLA